MGQGRRWAGTGRKLAAGLAGAAAVAATALVGVSGAGAATSAPSLQLATASAPPGGVVSVTGNRFSTLAAGSVRLGSTQVATFTTDRRGGFSATFKVPATAVPGATTVTAATGGLSAGRPFTVGSSGPVLVGVSTPSGARDLTQLDAFERDAGARAGMVMYFQGWAHDEFDPTLARSVAARGSVPLIAWEPWDYRAGLDQPTYRLSRILDGTHDAYITRWAQGAKAYGGRLLVRFAHEMNDRHYPWSEQVSGNQPGQYAQAWRHVVSIFRSVGATNVGWVWAPNVSYAGTTPLKGLYPGDSYVDWVGVDGYNGGTALPWGGWLTFSQIFGSTLAELAAVTTTKPVMIAETASTEVGGSKASWITDFFAQLAARPQIKAFVWFNHDKETDWRIQSSESARQAFAAGVARTA